MKIESQHVGQYELRQRLQQHSTGETWQAYDTTAQCLVILKFYRTDILDTSEALTEYLQRIEELASLRHPNIVHIRDIQVLAPRSTGESVPLICLAIECIQGETLADYIGSTSAAGKLPLPSDVMQIFSALASALDSTHQRGVVHGNLKPTNILFDQGTTTQGRLSAPLLTDFAISKISSKKAGHEVPLYLAPEQIKGAPVDERTDIYALGVLLYELYTGMPPFRGNRPIAVMMQHINAAPTSPDLVNPGISPAIAQVILRCLAKEPQQRFPGPLALRLALANALHMPVPEHLQRIAFSRGITASLGSPPLPTETDKQQNIPIRMGERSLQDAALLRSRRRSNRYQIVVILLTLLLLLSAGFGTMRLVQRNSAALSAGAGQAFFMNSGQLNENTTQGINDELQVDLANLPAPSAGKSYYAWLLGDVKQSEALPLFLGRLSTKDGSVHFLYTGDRQHTNLLAVASRFLVTEENSRAPSSNPLLNQRTWRYYAVLPQTPDPADALHFSMLDHLRHLLVESPELSIRGLHGGLAFWFARDSATVANLASSLAEDWQNKSASVIHTQMIRMLDYLDGSAFIKTDVPGTAPWLADTRVAQIPLLGPVPQTANPPGYVYQNETPPGYVYLVQTHLNGVVLAPQATAEQHQIAVQISDGIDNARQALNRVYQDAKRLQAMSNTQLLQTASLTILDDLATQAQYAYTGQSNPSTGSLQGGALWIYDNLQRLATFEVQAYSAPKS